MRPVAAAADVAAALGLEAGVELIRIGRLRHIDNDPFSFTVNYLPVAIGNRIRAKDLYSVPLLKILQVDLRIPIVRAQETIDAVPAEPEIAQKLGISVLSGHAHETDHVHDRQQAIRAVETFYRADSTLPVNRPREALGRGRGRRKSNLRLY
jgi:GntR family transcriptional regulator